MEKDGMGVTMGAECKLLVIISHRELYAVFKTVDYKNVLREASRLFFSKKYKIIY